MGAARERRGRRHLSVGVFAVALMLSVAAIGYRTFAPRDTLDRAQDPYPAPARATPGLFGRLVDMPLVVDGRLRVYAAQREVWADAPVDSIGPMSPYWAYHRWPAQVLGVVAVGTTVVSRWSDGDLVAIDATRGTIAWRVRTVSTGARYAGRRTGAATVYLPTGMYTAGRVLLVIAGTEVTGYDVRSGRSLWRRHLGRCAGRGYFTGRSVLAVVDPCTQPATVQAYDGQTGRVRAWPALSGGDPQPVACAVGRSECRAVRTRAAAWLIGADGDLVPAPSLAEPGSWLAGDVVVRPLPDGSVTGVALAGGRRLWSWPGAGDAPDGTRIIAVEPDAVHLLTGARVLISLDPADGLELCRVETLVHGNTMFDPGFVYAVRRFVFVERLRPGARPGDPDPRYYYPSPAVLATGS
jgi:outer membrane protein assembly factor BamB